jgi:hypothetical protein
MQAQQQQGIIQNGSLVLGSGSVTSSVQIAPLSSLSSAQNSNALNSPGRWDVFISHTQRNPEGKLMGLDLHNTLATMGKSSWLDVKMDKMSIDAMEEGVKNASCVVAIITDSCTTAEDDPKKGGPEQNAYFNRWMCQQELRWAIKYNVPIQPVIRAEDKKKIGDFIKMAPDDLKFLGGIDWKHMDRGNKRYFDLGIDMVIEGVDELVAKAKKQQHETVVGGAGGLWRAVWGVWMRLLQFSTFRRTQLFTSPATTSPGHMPRFFSMGQAANQINQTNYQPKST